ncbi:hypothetical protein GCM10027403_16980 [Arthrobacter tecti]
MARPTDTGLVANPSLCGGTYNLFAHTLKKFGITVTFMADPVGETQRLISTSAAALSASPTPWRRDHHRLAAIAATMTVTAE